MVKSRIVNKTYSETDGIENLLSQINNLIEYGYRILGNEYDYSNIVLGTHILDYKTVIFPIYLLDNNHNFYDLHYPQIGVFEMDKELFSSDTKLLTDTGHLDLEKYWYYCNENNLEYCKPLLFPKIVNKNNSIIKQVLNNTYTPIKLPQFEKAATYFSNKPVKSSFGTSRSSKFGKPIVDKKWLRVLFPVDKNVKIIETLFNGDCFFDALAKTNMDIYSSRSNDEKIKIYREIVANNISSNSFDNKKQSLKELVENQIKINEQIHQTMILISEITNNNKQSETIEVLHQLQNNLKSLQQEEKSITENKSHIGNLDNIESFEDYKNLIKKKEWWADESAIDILEKELNIKLIIIQSDYIKDYVNRGLSDPNILTDIQSHLIVNPINCSSAESDISQTIPNDWNPDYYIILEHTGNHYKLIEYEQKRKLQFEEIPQIIKDIIKQECIKRQLTGNMEVDEEISLNNYEKIQKFINEKFNKK